MNFVTDATSERIDRAEILDMQNRSLEVLLAKDQMATLLHFVASVTPDRLNCDGCLKCVPELAESQLGDQPLSELLDRVHNHLDNCACCRNEYEDFLRALDGRVTSV